MSYILLFYYMQKAPSHYSKLIQRMPAYGKFWHSLVYPEVRSGIVLKSLLLVFYKFMFVVVRSVWRDFSTRNNDKSRDIRERSRTFSFVDPICCHTLQFVWTSFWKRCYPFFSLSSRKLMFTPFGKSVCACHACTKWIFRRMRANSPNAMC